MKALIILILPLSLFGQLNDQTKVELLKKYYQGSFEKDSIDNRKLFFQTFPSSFQELQDLYGYENSTAAPLYEHSLDHIHKLFNNLKCIDETSYYKKLVDISIGGRWDADGISFFQRGLQIKVFKNPELTLTVLKDYKTKEIESFFYFLFDGIHPMWKTVPDELDIIKKLDNNIYSLAVSAMKKVVKNNPDHH